MRCAEYLDAEDMEHYELILASPDSAARTREQCDKLTLLDQTRTLGCTTDHHQTLKV